MSPTRFRLGTSSWSAKGWVGPFYPPGTPPRGFLAHYAEHFTTVEADVTYYRMPDRKLVAGWKSAVPDGFQVSAKFPRTIVHAGDGPRPDADTVLVWERVGGDALEFVERMSALEGNLGPLVLQFPYFNQRAFPSVEPFLERLDGFLERLSPVPRLAVEVRNKHWVDTPLLDLLRARGVALVLVDLAYMPHPAEFQQRFDLVTTDFVYCRLIGDRQAVEAHTKTFDRIVVDRSDRLERWAAFLKDLQGVPEAYVYANNHFAGHGPATVRALERLL
ncbi:MAG: DUF72 domain-containing protein [Planctomycetota bacterium]